MAVELLKEKTKIENLPYHWSGDYSQLVRGALLNRAIEDLSSDYFLVIKDGQLNLARSGIISQQPIVGDSLPCAGVLNAFRITDFGDKNFHKHHKVSYSYMIGSMANGIACEELVIRASNAGFLSSFGSGGLSIDRIDKALEVLTSSLPNKTFAVNLLNNPREPAREMELAKLLLNHGVSTVEASAFIQLSLPLLYYRVAGYGYDVHGAPQARNKVIAKISRPEVASHFMNPAPKQMVDELLSKHLITKEQAELARYFPVADDLTVEADSGGHTDNRPLVSLFPYISELRNRIQGENNYLADIRLGAAGGIGTPEAVLAAFSMGAAYVVTGSINQTSVEAATSQQVKELLSQAEMADVAMAPAADMFEVGAQVQVLKKGTMYSINARKLYDIYKLRGGVNELSESEKLLLEGRIFRRPINEIWQDVVDYFKTSSPDILNKCETNSKYKLGLILRWYLGMSSKWAIAGDVERVVDYQVWCGQSMGAFNSWARNTDLEELSARHVDKIGLTLLDGAARLKRRRQLYESGVDYKATEH